MKLPNHSQSTISIIGLGYVGLPLLLQFSKHKDVDVNGTPLFRRIIGYDINSQRIDEIKNSYDRTNELSPADFDYLDISLITCTSDDLIGSDIYIITVPTPVDIYKRPDFSALVNASQMIGRCLLAKSKSCSGSTPLIILESTVYPGATREICAAEIEKISGLSFNVDFFCGYSPERINPGDKIHTVDKVLKVTSGSTNEAALLVDHLYKSIISAGTHLAPSIEVAEASKVIENTQRDINIALINELSIIFDKLSIDTYDVLEAAKTKWNFLDFTPGLVGGHCIGVDPYYLTHKAVSVDYTPHVVLSGRRINDFMPSFVCEKLFACMANANALKSSPSVLILGITFKKNCPDIRNSKVLEIVKNLNSMNITPCIYDPWIEEIDLPSNISATFLKNISSELVFDAVIAAVAHDEFKHFDSSFYSKLTHSQSVVLDLTSQVPREVITWRL